MSGCLVSATADQPGLTGGLATWPDDKEFLVHKAPPLLSLSRTRQGRHTAIASPRRAGCSDDIGKPSNGRRGILYRLCQSG